MFIWNCINKTEWLLVYIKSVLKQRQAWMPLWSRCESWEPQITTAGNTNFNTLYRWSNKVGVFNITCQYNHTSSEMSSLFRSDFQISCTQTEKCQIKNNKILKSKHQWLKMAEGNRHHEANIIFNITSLKQTSTYSPKLSSN